MSRWILFGLTTLAMAVATPLAAQDDSTARYEPVLGSWQMTMETPRGSFTQEFEFMLDEGVLKGKVHSQRGTSDLKKVKFEAGKLTFKVVRNFRNRSITQNFTAKIEGDEMKGTISGGRRGERPFTATRKRDS